MRAPTLKLKITCSLPIAKVQKLSPEDQAEAAYALLGRVADELGDFGFDPNIIAHVTSDLGFDVMKLAGGPAQVVRMPRRKG